jgi:hypothetical protein
MGIAPLPRLRLSFLPPEKAQAADNLLNNSDVG